MWRRRLSDQELEKRFAKLEAEVYGKPLHNKTAKNQFKQTLENTDKTKEIVDCSLDIAYEYLIPRPLKHTKLAVKLIKENKNTEDIVTEIVGKLILSALIPGWLESLLLVNRFLSLTSTKKAEAYHTKPLSIKFIYWLLGIVISLLLLVIAAIAIDVTTDMMKDSSSKPEHLTSK